MYRSMWLPRQKFWLMCIATYVLIETAGRLVLMAIAASAGAAIGNTLLASLFFGMINDAAIALILGLPFLLGLHLFARALRRWPMRMAAHVCLFVLLSLLFFEQVAAATFWNEFDSRFNAIAVNYLIFPREVIGVVHESFDNRLLLIAPLGALLCYPFLRSSLNSAITAPPLPFEGRRAVGEAAAAVVLAIFLVLSGPLTPSGDREIQELTANGVERLLTAALMNDQAYDGIYIGMDDARATSLVRSQVAQDNTEFIAATARSVTRTVTSSDPERKLNVVLVLEESFGSVYVDSTDNRSGEEISPNLDRLSKNGLFFSNIYATGNRTVNALEAVLTSFPPIPGISTARRPGSQGMYSLPALLSEHGYATAFLYGGRKAFDNMGNFWKGIGYDVVWDQNDIAAPGFSTIWGVSDEDLFDEALRRIDSLSTASKPFLLTLLTVSNHRPFLYPSGRIAKDPSEKRRQNAATYADWAFGHFVETAEKHPWFGNTIFIFIGDHGPRVYGAAVVPTPSFRVPLLFYSPANIPPALNPVAGSSIDVAPTLLGLLGLTYTSPFFGVDLRRVPADRGRIVMQHNFAIAYGDGRDVAIIGPGLKVWGYDMTLGPEELSPATVVNQTLLDRVVAISQTAHRMFYAKQYHRSLP